MYYDASEAPKDPWKSNGLGDVVYNLSQELNIGDCIYITSESRSNDWMTTLLITAEYANGNRGFTSIYKYTTPDTIERKLKDREDRSWRSLTDGTAWLDFWELYRLEVRKGVY